MLDQIRNTVQQEVSSKANNVRSMKSSVCLLSIIVALCLGHVLPRGLEEQKVVSFDLDVIRPWHDCLKQLGNDSSNNTRNCDVNLLATKSITLENLSNCFYLLKLQVGSKRQEFKVLVDIGSSRLWVFGTDCKDDKDVNCKDHPKYNSAESDTYEEVKEDFNIEYTVGEVKGKQVKDTIYFSDTLKAEKQLFGSASWVDDKMDEDGVIGLNMNKKWGDNPAITAMKAAGMKPIFSLYLKGEGTAVDGGEITFGGVNEARLKSLAGIEVKVVGDGEFVLQMDEVKFGEKVMCTKDGEVYCKVLIDSGNSKLEGPKALIDDFILNVLKAAKLGTSFTVKCDDVKDLPDIKIKFGEKTLTLEAKYYTEKLVTNCLIKLDGVDEPDKHWVFGQPFLQKFVTEFDMKAESPSVTFYEAK